MRRSTRLVAAAVVLGCAASGAHAQASAPLAFARPITVIAKPTTGELKAPISEPHMVVGRNGRIYVSASFQGYDCTTGAASTSLGDCVWASDDERAFHVSGGMAKGGGDNTHLAVTDSGTVVESAMANVGLGSGIPGATVSRSADGRTWTRALVANKLPFTDRPYLLSAGPRNLLMTFAPVPGGVWGARSTDDGRSFGMPLPIVATSLAINGQPVLDKARGDLVVPFMTTTVPGCQSGFTACFNVLGIARSHDAGSTWSQVTAVTMTDGSGAMGPPIVTADDSGNEFVTYGTAHYTLQGQALPVGPARAWMARLLAGSSSWSAPQAIESRAGSEQMPAVVAAGKNCVAALYFRSASSDAEVKAASWDVVIAVSGDGGRTYRRSVIQKGVYDGPGQIRVPIFIDQNDIKLDGSGRIIAVWTNTHHVNDGSSNSIDFVRQSTGPALAGCRR